METLSNVKLLLAARKRQKSWGLQSCYCYKVSADKIQAQDKMQIQQTR